MTRISELLTPRRRQSLTVAGFVVFTIALPSACDDHLIGDAAPITTSCLREPPLDWENFGAGIIGRFCLGCHGINMREGQRMGAPPDINFDTYEDVVKWADGIKADTIDSDRMPPSGG